MEHQIRTVLFLEFQDKTSAIHLLTLIKELQRTGSCNCVLFGEKDSYLSQETAKLHIPTYVIRYQEFNVHDLTTYLPLAKTLLLMISICFRHHVDIIHSHRLNWAYLGIVVSWLLRKPLVVDIVYLEQLTSKIQVALIKNYHRVTYLAVSQHAKREFQRLYQLSPARISVFCGGVGIPERHTPVSPKILRQFNIPAHHRIIGMVSRLAPSKGVDVFIEAAGLLKRSWQNASFVFIGYQKNKFWGENYYEICQRRIKNLRLEGRFAIIKFTHNIEKYYPVMYCTVLPTWIDALAYVAIESQAFRKPVIITDVGGTSEAVNHGKTGMLLPYPPSPILLAKAIDTLLRNKDIYSHYAEVGHRWVQLHYNVKKNVYDLLNIYQTLFLPH